MLAYAGIRPFSSEGMMDFEELKNPWSEYRAPDGRILRVRHVLTEVTQSGLADDGTPNYTLNFAMVAHVGPKPETKPVLLGGQHSVVSDCSAFAQNALNSSKKGLQ